ncbi:DnaJ protein-like [Hondaea fermentalgiana]|uniref:DnaJ protein-like n=1 Tax=Hondaea fermentalgiana TaxID=2315210 RepID=A0A2R5GH33_9STRA|nr:DnaJ protein-like [Hondaea fermentalgiana]|eukprot:GBG30216.1 DnaJ protein-like [Hondaea fermentalgiana]
MQQEMVAQKDTAQAKEQAQPASGEGCQNDEEDRQDDEEDRQDEAEDQEKNKGDEEEEANDETNDVKEAEETEDKRNEDDGDDDEEEDDEEESRKIETFEDLEPFDLYKTLKLSASSCNADRARTAYHRRAHNYHPRRGRKASAIRFAKAGFAYEILRDDERRRIYDQHGFPGLVASEKFMGTSVFDLTPNDIYNQFFSEENKEYFFLNGASIYLSDSEEEDSDQEGDDANEAEDDEEEEEEEEAAALAAAAALEADEAARERFAEKLRQIESKPMPKLSPAASTIALMTQPSLMGGSGEADIFKEIKRRFAETAKEASASEDDGACASEADVKSSPKRPKH